MSKKIDQSSFSANPLKEGDDFYFNDDGLMVLTEKYHLKRGYCCKSDCTHCPFETSKKIDPNIPQEFQTNWSDEEECEQEQGKEDLGQKKYVIDPKWGID
jgi:hypothetical protein